jgi:hypothetical protein
MVLLSSEQVDQFQRDGYVPLGPLLTAEQVEKLRTALDELWAQWASALGVSTEDYCRVVSQWTNVWEAHPAFAAQLRDPRLAAMAATLIGCRQVRLQAARALPHHPLAPRLSLLAGERTTRGLPMACSRR